MKKAIILSLLMLCVFASHAQQYMSDSMREIRAAQFEENRLAVIEQNRKDWIKYFAAKGDTKSIDSMFAANVQYAARLLWDTSIAKLPNDTFYDISEKIIIKTNNTYNRHGVEPAFEVQNVGDTCYLTYGTGTLKRVQGGAGWTLTTTDPGRKVIEAFVWAEGARPWNNDTVHEKSYDQQVVDIYKVTAERTTLNGLPAIRATWVYPFAPVDTRLCFSQLDTMPKIGQSLSWGVPLIGASGTKTVLVSELLLQPENTLLNAGWQKDGYYYMRFAFKNPVQSVYNNSIGRNYVYSEQIRN